MNLVSAVMTGFLASTAAFETPAVVVAAADAPVTIGRATLLTVAGDPPVVLYAATNQTTDELEQFTVMVFIFDSNGVLKFRQVAPGRRTLEPKSTKYSTIILDGGPVDPGASIVIGVNQVQRLNSDSWWRADLESAAQTAVPRKKP